jgi:hypothetical protein
MKHGFFSLKFDSYLILKGFVKRRHEFLVPKIEEPNLRSVMDYRGRGENQWEKNGYIFRASNGAQRNSAVCKSANRISLKLDSKEMIISS